MKWILLGITVSMKGENHGIPCSTKETKIAKN